MYIYYILPAALRKALDALPLLEPRGGVIHRRGEAEGGEAQVGLTRVNPSDSTSSFLSSKRRNSWSKLAQVPEQSEFTYGAYLVAAGHL